METLNIHQLKGYLGTGLKILVYGQNVFENHICELNSLSNDNEAFFYGEWNNISNNEEYFKPILYPLSDLTKEITVNGETITFYYHFMSESDLNSINKSIELKQNIFDYISANLYEKMLEYKFDVNGLIEKGLAIDINSLDTNPYL